MPPKRKAAFSHNPRKVRRISQDEDTEEAAPLDLTDPSSLPPRAIEQARQNVSSKITSGNKIIFRALKKARGFEKQKLAKRLKAARDKKDDSAVQKLVLELEAVKNADLDLTHLASTHILKTLLKSKQISTSPLFPPSLILEKDAAPSASSDDRETARRNVIARLYNSVPVKEGMAAVLGSVRSTMGLEEGAVQTKSKKEKKVGGGSEKEVAPSEEKDIRMDDQYQVSQEAVTKDKKPKPLSEDEEMLDTVDATSEEESDDSEESGQEEEDVQDIWSKLESAPDNVFAEFDERLAGSSSSEDEDHTPEELPPDQIRTDDEWSGSEDEAPDASSSEDEEGEEGTEEGGKEEEEDKPPISKKKAPTSNSTYFLPSLLSGYISGSSSDSEEESSRKKGKKKKGPPEKAVRKNRMGQQARRALWEKKFGAAANHVKSQQEKNGHDANRGGVRGGRGSRGRGGGARGGSTSRPNIGGQGQESNGNGERRPDESKKKAQEGPLHPSWEAVRKAKEQQAAAKPQGKKITFD